ncbi:MULTISPECIES: methylated-DNA--[protein]-cysteine S-methyltransferase [unclassified Thioalkalivibrio]|uniref:methylated-DNA--[protein]-cysteine S-methyltransferase n=1 Tax=unclassified Thioalkalivibrio TaxID=2621013 RepID=UPI0003736A13|nr:MULTISPECIES: MGMT family protein [unclassified Thioalkalivibrio]
MQGRRCILPGASLAFVYACDPENSLLLLGWEGHETRVPVPLRLPFAPEVYARDPRAWVPPDCLPPGSPHQQRVWHALTRIPVGETRTYGQIARAIGSSPQAVGQACRANPWPLFIPCHRVLPAGAAPDRGSAGGYAGQVAGPLAAAKQALLRHEANRQTEINGNFLQKGE